MAFLVLRPETARSQLKPDFEEVLIAMNVQRIGNIEILAIIHAQEVYLPVKELFDFLKIKNTPSADYDSISGFFIHPRAAFVINQAYNRIVYENNEIKLGQDDLIRTPTDLYMRSVLFGRVFGLECAFNFRSLSMSLTTKFELPAIRELQQEQMRRNISRLKGEKTADTTILRDFPLFRVGTADWSVMSTQAAKGQNYTRINLGLGAMIFGGEANVNLNHSSNLPFDIKQQYYQWRYVNNDNKGLRQITAGKIFPQSISSVFGSLVGFQLTNTPTTYRRSFGTYRLTDNTEPGWTVELYVNNVLVNYTKADASGFFSFEVPIVYGNSLVKLRYYGPWGEERVKEQSITIPFNFLPVGQMEYSFTAGFLEDEDKNLFSRATINYGLSRHITVGAGMEYLSSMISGSAMPFVNASARLGSSLLLSGEHTHGVRTRGVLSFRRPSNLQIDLNYVKYDKNQTAVRYNFDEEQKAVISMPFRSRKFTAFSRLTVNRYKMAKFKQTGGEFLLSTVFAGVSSNLTTFATFNEAKNPLVYSNLSMTFRLPGGIRFTPQAQYEYRQANFSILRGEAEKIIFKNGYLNLSYERDLINKARYMGMGLRYNFSFAQTFFAVRQAGATTEMTQSARGSLVYNDETHTLKADNQPNVGRGGLIISPFLDLNCNGIRDANEPKAAGLRMKMNGRNVQRHDRDTTLQINNLESYVSYTIELNKASFDNVAWQIKNNSISIAIEPNHFKRIEIPVAVLGEVSGTVFLKGKGLNGIGRMIVNIYNSDHALVTRVISETDGYFSYLGLAPGKYSARVDEAQLLKLNMMSSGVNTSFIIKSNTEGDVVEDLHLTVIMKEVLKSNEEPDDQP